MTIPFPLLETSTFESPSIAHLSWLPKIPYGFTSISFSVPASTSIDWFSFTKESLSAADTLLPDKYRDTNWSFTPCKAEISLTAVVDKLTFCSFVSSFKLLISVNFLFLDRLIFLHSVAYSIPEMSVIPLFFAVIVFKDAIVDFRIWSLCTSLLKLELIALYNP